MKINGPKLREIKERIKRVRQGADEMDQVLNDADLMVDLLQEIRETVHYAEDPDCLLGIAADLGTNCTGKDIDET